MNEATTTRETKLRTVGFSLLFIGMAIGGLARSLHVGESVAVAMNGASIACSLGALVLFFKSRPNRRTHIVVMIVAALLVAAVVAAVVIGTHHT